MNIATLAAILDHLPGDLTVYTPAGELWEVRRNPDLPYLTAGVWLDTGPRLRLKGRFREAKTLRVRLDQLVGEPVG